MKHMTEYNGFYCIILDGYLQVYGKRAHTPYKLIAAVYERHTVPIKYVSFASWENAPAEYFYDCAMAWPPFYGTPLHRNHPLLNDPSLPPDVVKRNGIVKSRTIFNMNYLYYCQTSVLVSKCRSSTHFKHEYTKFWPLSGFRGGKAKGYIARIAVYALRAHDAHIAFAVNDRPGNDDAIYEFGRLLRLVEIINEALFHAFFLLVVIGGWDNSRVLIRRKKGSDVMNELHIADILSKTEPSKIVIEITERKLI